MEMESKYKALDLGVNIAICEKALVLCAPQVVLRMTVDRLRGREVGAVLAGEKKASLAVKGEEARPEAKESEEGSTENEGEDAKSDSSSTTPYQELLRRLLQEKEAENAALRRENKDLHALFSSDKQPGFAPAPQVCAPQDFALQVSAPQAFAPQASAAAQVFAPVAGPVPAGLTMIDLTYRASNSPTLPVAASPPPPSLSTEQQIVNLEAQNQALQHKVQQNTEVMNELLAEVRTLRTRQHWTQLVLGCRDLRTLTVMNHNICHKLRRGEMGLDLAAVLHPIMLARRDAIDPATRPHEREEWLLTRMLREGGELPF
ncbi:uncharacterized protein K452DRAFT_315793 [Aplosporella prunicola CBS 121167]|uniref:Uncharacterized protein n=1 Tax=Aplosporella prunicola CBS 121167 TaxID=1176127 RepID=A0A6A6BPE3_9PEZI|nr:uncharacterized protein K452DRAFT_315793 [Aplosporella prunicola CBS 121167]KAF2145578.1 hypothetical protein K452DRAFT_315793 [Aplosporella prunicola CBS 121167]